MGIREMKHLCSAAAAFLLAACGTATMTTPSTVAKASPAVRTGPQYVYVSNEIQSGSGWASTLNIYSAKLNGDIQPVAIIGGSSTQLGQVNGVAVNGSGEIYVVNTNTDTIVGFAAGSSGNVAPNVVIGGSYTGLAWPVGMTIDASGNLYVANCASECGGGSALPSVEEFAAGSNGNVAPIKAISGSETQLTYANAVAVDSSGNIYVSNIYGANTIDVFDPSANGDASPTRVISGSKTLLYWPFGLAVDSHGLYTDSLSGYIERFALDANGNVPPVAAISGHKTLIDGPDGMAVDQRGIVYATSAERVLKFTALAKGDVRPVGKLEGSRTELTSPAFLYAR